jgi:hypothetical protein
MKLKLNYGIVTGNNSRLYVQKPLAHRYSFIHRLVFGEYLARLAMSARRHRGK